MSPLWLRLAPLLLVTFVVAGCALLDNNPSGLGGDCLVQPDVSIGLTSDALTVTNCTDEPIYTFIVGSQIAPLILWFPSVEGPGIEPGATATYTFEELHVDDRETELIVNWWHAIHDNGERKHGLVQVIRFSL